jgi:hypothetical protein
MAAGKSLLLRLMARLGEISVRASYLPKDGRVNVSGYTYPDGSITVNVIPETVDTVVHELLHSLYPRYNEATVRRLTKKLMHDMTDDEIKAFYEVFSALTGD